MTPDELRRMDEDLCIIFEKGIKPVKAKKYYYFKHQKMLKDLNAYKLDHNNFEGGERGTWRKYNPYNPYVPEDENKEKAQNLKVESLDDLFEDNFSEVEEKKEEKATTNNLLDAFEEPKLTASQTQQEEKVKPFSDDIQKELEAKFDELFGKIDA